MFCHGKRVLYLLVLAGIVLLMTQPSSRVMALVITDILPSPDQAEVSPSVEIKVFMSAPVRPESVHVFSAYLVGGQRRVPGRIYYLPDEKCIGFTPLQPLRPGAGYTFVLTREVVSVQGDSLTGASRWSFNTAGPETGQRKQLSPEGIRLLSSRPADGEVCAGFPGRIVLRFNKPLLADSLSLFTVRLTDGSDFILGAIDQGKASGEFTFVPNHPLSGGGEYTLIIGPGLFTDDGEYLDRELRVRFSLAESTQPAPAVPATPVSDGPDVKPAVEPVGETVAAPVNTEPHGFGLFRRGHGFADRLRLPG